MSAVREEFSVTPYIHLNDIDCIDIDYQYHTSESSHKVSIMTCGTASDCPIMPPPAEFNRNWKSCGISALLSRSIRAPQSDTTFESVYKLQRQYVRTLIMEEDVTKAALSQTNPLFDEWSVWDEFFPIE